MAGNNKIQFLRGTKAKRLNSAETLNAGQPFFETDTHTLYVGTGDALVHSVPVSANPLEHKHNYAHSATAGGPATSANKVNGALTVNVNGQTTTYDGSTNIDIDIDIPQELPTAKKDAVLMTNSSKTVVWQSVEHAPWVPTDRFVQISSYTEEVTWKVYLDSSYSIAMLFVAVRDNETETYAPATALIGTRSGVKSFSAFNQTFYLSYSGTALTIQGPSVYGSDGRPRYTISGRAMYL